MPSGSTRDRILSDLGDDVISDIPPKKSNHKRRKHVLQKSKRSRLPLNDHYRSTVHGEGLDLFIQTKIFQDYLQCEAKPWTYPKRSTDKIDLEPIPSTFLPPLKTGPLYLTISGKNKKSERFRRVCGYREIFMKRMHVKYLEDKEKENVYSILYPEKAVQDMDSSLLENDTALRFEIQNRFRNLNPGGGSSKPKRSKDRYSSRHGKKSKSQHRTKYNNKSKPRQGHPEYEGVQNEHQQAHKSKHKRSGRVSRKHSKEMEKSQESYYESHKSHRRGKSRPNDEDNNYPRTKMKSKDKKTQKSKSRNRGEFVPHKNISPKATMARGRSRDNSRIRQNHFAIHEWRKHDNPKQQYERSVRSVSKKEQSLPNPNFSSEETLKKHKKSQKTEAEKVEKGQSGRERHFNFDREKSDNMKLNKKQSSEEEPNAEHHVRVSTQPDKANDVEKNRNLKHKTISKSVEPHKRFSKDLNNNEISSRQGQAINIPQFLPIAPKIKVPPKLEAKNHAELIRRKLEDWAKDGNHHRIRPSQLSQPDENANYLISESPRPVETQHVDMGLNKTGSSGSDPRQHTVITMHDDQTPSKIAEQFRSQPIYVYTAAVSKHHGQSHPHGHGHHQSHPHGHGKLHTHGTSSHNLNHGHGQGDKHSKHSAMNMHDKEHHAKHDLPHFDITNFDSYYKYVYGVKIKDLPERDSEWLELSETDESELDEEIQSFEKANPKWMIPDISFESQQLVSELTLMYWVCRLTGRMFYYTKPNFLQGHLEFLTRRVRMIPFFLSSFILWAALVSMSQSYASIEFKEVETNITQTPGTAQQQVLIEQLEIKKYGPAILYVIANLSFVAVWSVFVIMRDGQLITHYFNCWCPALAEMETSSAVGIRRMTLYNLSAWLASSAILVTGFIFKFPDNIRGTAGLLAILMFRNVFPDIRLKSDKDVYYFQLFGLIFIIYVLFCARMLFNLMQIIALIIKNSAEMWNFKFALAFNQLMMTNRGHMKRISLQLPLVKFFTHHRIMTALVKIYGDIFGVPIMIYMVLQIGLVTYMLVHLFNYKAGNIQDYYGKQEVQYEYYPKNSNETRIIKIEFYHSPVEEISTGLFILVSVCFDYMFTTEVLAAASQSFRDGFEFVRRTNLILCKTSHQRRLIQSLLWSMSDTHPTLISAGNYFLVYRPTIVEGLGVAIGFFSLIIQLQSTTESFYIEFPPCSKEKVKNTIEEPRCKPKADR